MGRFSDHGAAPVTPAASLILLRDAPRLEVLVGARPAEAKAFPGAIVCPGGKLDPQDYDPVWANRLCADGPAPLAAAVAAMRETFEESGVLVARDDAGRPPQLDRKVLAVARADVATGNLPFSDVLDRWGLRLDGAALVPFAHWITPVDNPYRFDTRFFLAVAPDPRAALIPTREFVGLNWREVQAVVEAGRTGCEPLMRPTMENLARVARSPTAQSALASARTAQRQGRPTGTL